MKKQYQYYVWHWHYEDCSNGETKYMPSRPRYDRVFDSEAEAKAWINEHRHPNWNYQIQKEELEEYIPRQHCGSRECNRGPAYCECFEDL